MRNSDARARCRAHVTSFPLPLVCVMAMLSMQCMAPMDGGDDTPDALVFGELSAAMISITGTSPADVYTVGADPGAGTGPYVLHYNGQAWKRLATGATGDLWWISQSRIGDAYFLAGEGGMILRFDPDTESFTRLTTPGDGTVFGVWGTGDGQAWAVGGDLDNPDAGGFVWRYDGNTWSAEDVSEAVPGPLPILYKVWGRGADDIYVVGRLGVILHYDGATWSQVPSDTERTLFTVHGNANDVVAVGGLGDAVIEEFDGESFVNRADSTLLQLNGVCVPDTGSAAAAGNDGTIVRRSGAGWEEVSTGISTSRDFHGVWVDAEGGIWAVGGNLTAALDNGLIVYVGTRNISSAVR